MVDREGFTSRAGSGKKLNIIRYGREEMTQYELPNGEEEDAILPGMALMRQSGDNTAEFVHHNGEQSKTVYIAVEARGRGMDAQTDKGYDGDNELVIAVNPSGGGLNLMAAQNENFEEGDSLVPQADTGLFVGETDEGWVFAESAENIELTDADGLVSTEVAGQ